MSEGGTIRTVKINKVAYNASGEADLSFKVGKYTIESQPTTGPQNNFKRMKQNNDIENVDIVDSAAKIDLLEQFIDSRVDGDLEVTFADGTTYTNSGGVSVTGTSSADNKVTATLHGRTVWTKVIV